MSRIYSKPDSLEDIVQDADIIVRGNVQNAREYMETFQAIQYQNVGIDSQENMFFEAADPNNQKRILFLFLNGLILGLFLVAIITGFIYAPQNDFPAIPTLASYVFLFYLFLSAYFKTYNRNKSCTTPVNAVIIGKYLYKEKNDSDDSWQTITNTIFLFEYLTNLYIVYQQDDRNYYGEIGDTHPLFINPENPFIHCTEEYRKESMRYFPHMLAFLIVAGIFLLIFYIVSLLH